MRRRRFSRGGTDLKANPFVVLSDLTIGLTFFFAVLSLVAALANSQGILVAQRAERQTGVRADIRAAFDAAYPGVTEELLKSPEGDEYRNLMRAGNSIGQIWENGNFQRIMIYPGAFQPNGTEPTVQGKLLYSALARSLKKHVSSLGYLFVHGIAEPAESNGTKEGKVAALDLSRERADVIRSILVKEGLISRSASKNDSQEMARKFAISYGTGTELYIRGGAAAKNWGTGKMAGRVDLVLFFNDNVERRSRERGPAGL